MHIRQRLSPKRWVGLTAYQQYRVTFVVRLFSVAKSRSSETLRSKPLVLGLHRVSKASISQSVKFQPPWCITFLCPSSSGCALSAPQLNIVHSVGFCPSKLPRRGPGGEYWCRQYYDMQWFVRLRSIRRSHMLLMTVCGLKRLNDITSKPALSTCDVITDICESFVVVAWLLYCITSFAVTTSGWTADRPTELTFATCFYRDSFILLRSPRSSEREVLRSSRPHVCLSR